MVTANIQQRFTATQALEFLRTDVRSNLRPDLLYERVSQGFLRGAIEDDRWEGLSPEFVVKWMSYRAPKPTYLVLFLRRICVFHWAWCIVRFLRRCARPVHRLLRNMRLCT